MIRTSSAVTTLMQRLSAVLWLGLALAAGPLYAQATIAATKDSLEFPAIAVGDSTVDSLYVKNTHVLNTLTVDTLSLIHGTVFTIDTTYGIIPPGDSLKVRVTYSPSAFGDDVDSLLIISNAANAETLYVYLSGSSPPPVITLRADELLYEETKIHAASVKTLMVVNTGTINTLTIDTVYSAGGGFVSSPDSGKITPGDSLALAVSFKPAKMEFYTDSLTIVSNDPEHPEVKVYVSGQGEMSHKPVQNAVAAAPDSAISVTFGIPMHPPSIDATTFLVNAARTGRVNGNFDYDINSHTSIFTPAEPFEYGDLVTVTLTTGIQDLMRDPLPKPYTWSFTTGVNAGSGYYDKVASPSVGDNPYYMTTGDWDGDGDLDLAVPNYYGNNVSLLTNSGTGEFSLQSGISTGAGGPQYLTAGDWDDDDDLDLAVANYSGDRISILTNDGAGTFVTEVLSYVKDGPWAICHGDWDSDGDLDLAATIYSENNFAIFLNDGAGAFTETATVPTSTYPTGIFPGDLDNDGDLDLVVVNRGANNVQVFKNSGAGVYSQYSTTTVGSYPHTLTGGDWDADGDLDLAVANYSSNTVSILNNDGSGNFSQSAAPGAGTGPYSVTAGDWDNDGDLDLAVGVWSSARVTILSNNGSGGFTNTTNISSGYYVRSIVHGDWDGDGSLDLAASNSSNDQVSIFKNRTAVNIVIDTGSLDYGLIKTNTSKELTFNISNTGAYQTLEVTDIVSSNPSFSVTPAAASVLPQDTVEFKVTFAPTEVGVYSDSLTIYSNDPDEPEKVLLLSGIGAPTVISTVPPANFLRGGPRTTVSATFNTPMQEATLNPASIHVMGDISGEHICAISYNSPTQAVVLTPDSNFIYGERVSIILTDDIKAVGGDVALQGGYGWNFLVSPLFGSGNFELDSTGYKSGAGPFTAVAGDFNRDGFADLAVANDGDNSVSVFLNDKSGGFAAPVPYAAGSAPQGIAVSDLNGDSYPDILAVNNGSDNVSVLMNKGNGTFAAASNYPVGTDPRPLAVGDLDNDGDMDVVVANVSSNDISVLMNDGLGAYTADTVITVGEAPSGVILEDLDSDADVDIAVSNKNSNNVSILLNQMPGFVASNPHSSGSNSAPNDLVAIDLNNDGSVDLATANRASDNIALLFNNGNGTFTAGTPIPAGDQPIDLYTHDFDADGDADLAVLNYGDFDVRTFVNDGQGGFTSGDTVSVVGGPRSLTGLDISGKIGVIDLVVVDILYDSVQVIRNQIKEGVLATVFLRQYGEQSGDIVFDYVAYNSSSTDSIGLTAQYSQDRGQTWQPATVSGDTSQLPPEINEGEIIWESDSENDLPAVDVDSIRFRIIAYSGSLRDTAYTDYFPLDNNQPPLITLSELEGYYKGDITISYTLSDNEEDSLSLLVEFKKWTATSWSGASIEGDTTDLTVYQDSLVWNSLSDLPDYSGQVLFRVIPWDNDPGQPDTIVFFVNQIGAPVVAVHEVFPVKNSLCCWYDRIKVTLSKPIDLSTVTSNVIVRGKHAGTVTISPAVQDTFLFLTPDSQFISLDSITIELKADMTDVYGLYLDGNNDGAPDGTPDDDYKWNFAVTALGDFNLDTQIDLSDLMLFRNAWFKRPQDLNYELGPFQGEIPYLRVIPDASLDFEDLVVFTGMWNWSQANVNPMVDLNTLAKANAGETVLRFEPVYLDNYKWADVSERSFALDLWVEEEGLPVGLGISMLLDPEVMQYKGFEPSDSLGKETNGWFVLDKYNEESGLLVLNMVNFSTSSNSANRSGYIGRLNAEVLQVGEITAPFKYDLWMVGADDSVYQGITVTNLSTTPPLPTEFALYQNYPNPFNPTTTIRFELPEAVDMHLVIYDILGREIVRLKDEQMEAGYHQVRWNSRDGVGRYVASGIYFARMATPGYSKTVKMLLLK